MAETGSPWGTKFETLFEQVTRERIPEVHVAAIGSLEPRIALQVVAAQQMAMTKFSTTSGNGSDVIPQLVLGSLEYLGENEISAYHDALVKSLTRVGTQGRRSYA